jgi:hypothetical protein
MRAATEGVRAPFPERFVERLIGFAFNGDDERFVGVPSSDEEVMIPRAAAVVVEPRLFLRDALDELDVNKTAGRKQLDDASWSDARDPRCGELVGASTRLPMPIGRGPAEMAPVLERRYCLIMAVDEAHAETVRPHEHRCWLPDDGPHEPKHSDRDSRKAPLRLRGRRAAYGGDAALIRSCAAASVRFGARRVLLPAGCSVYGCLRNRISLISVSS